jgi:tripartite-type tricarboxylate transporter receptor subunit TctC
VALIAEGEAVLLARNNVPFKTMGEMVSYAKANPAR